MAALLREAVRGAAREDARADKAGEAEGRVGGASAEAVFPVLGGREVHVGVADLAGLVQTEVEAVGAGEGGGGEDGVRGGGCVRGEVVWGVGDVVVGEGVRCVSGVRGVGRVGGIFADRRGGDGRYGGFVGKSAW